MTKDLEVSGLAADLAASVRVHAAFDAPGDVEEPELVTAPAEAAAVDAAATPADPAAVSIARGILALGGRPTVSAAPRRDRALNGRDHQKSVAERK